MVGVPLFPVLVELIKNGEIKPETFLLTAAVLAAGYGFSTQTPLSWGLYALIFLFSVAFDYRPEAALPLAVWAAPTTAFVRWILDHLALSLMLLTVAIHTLERFVWHVLRDFPFPDWRRGL